jgi:hypothetical protein
METSFSNAIRLTVREWLCVAVFAALLFGLPAAWKRYEPFALEPDQRMPHDLSNDYWLYQRFAELSVERYDTFLFGDSVIWGEYVIPKDTLSHYLNQLSGRERCANLGLDGAHPLAVAGLIEHYAQSVTGKNVLLHCNPLWLTSPRTDLQDDGDEPFNHPGLVPQFVPPITRYKKDVSHRIGILVEQRVAFSSWTGHLQQAYYGQSDIPGWTLKRPYDNPFGPLTRGLPQTDDKLRHEPIPWFQRGKRGELEQDYPWVDLDTSLQWQAFQRAVAILQKRGNRVFVLVGPFNEHLLKPASLKRYGEIKSAIARWLASEGIPHLVPAPLPSEQFGDASHPLAAGYEELARLLLAKRFIN